MPDGDDGSEPDERPAGAVGWLRWFTTSTEFPIVYTRYAVGAILGVALLAVLLFTASGLWPPMAAVESPSMEPALERGDLVFIIANERTTPTRAPTHNGTSTGVVPAARAHESGHTEFGRPGDVILFRRNGSTTEATVIHRAMLWVDAGENWYSRADPDAIGKATDCQALQYCPAPYAGFITQGDNSVTNPRYDQTAGITAPVKPEWIIGTAEIRIPYLGYIELAASEYTANQTTQSTSATTPRRPRPPATT